MRNKELARLRKELTSLLKSLKPKIRPEFRIDEGDTLPGIQVTVGVSIEDGTLTWDYQTGDNSYTGGAYGHPYWAVLSLHRRSNCSLLAQDAVDQIFQLYNQ